MKIIVFSIITGLVGTMGSKSFRKRNQILKSLNFQQNTLTFNMCAKSQLISKCLFVIFNSSKKQKQFDLSYHSS